MDRKLTMTFPVLYNHENRHFELCTRTDRKLTMTFPVLYNHETDTLNFVLEWTESFTHMEYLR